MRFLWDYLRNPQNFPTLIICGVIVVFTYLLAAEIIQRKDLDHVVHDQPLINKQLDLNEQISRLSSVLEIEFKKMEVVETSVVDTIYKYYQSVSRDSLKKKLESIFSKEDWVYGLGYALDAPPETANHYALYYYRLHKKTTNEDISNSYNYLKSKWYQKLINGEKWISPFYGTVASTKLVEVGRPLRLDGDTVGVSYVDIKADDVNALISKTLDLGLNGFAVALEKTKNEVGEDTTKAILWTRGWESLRNDSDYSNEESEYGILDKLWRETSHSADSANSLNTRKIIIGGQEFLWSNSTLKKTGWKVFAFYPVEDIDINTDKWYYAHAKMVAYFLIALALMLMLIRRKSRFGLVQGFEAVFYATIPMVILQLLYLGGLNAKGSEVKKENIIEQTKQATEHIEERLSVLESITKQIKDSVNYGRKSIPVDSVEIVKILKEIFQSHPEIFGLGLCWEPGIELPMDQLYSPFLFRPEKSEKDFVITQLSKATKEQIEEFSLDPYDYTKVIPNKTEWYHFIKEGTKLWQKPYYGGIAQTILTEYGEPIYASKKDKENGKPLGIVYADYSLKQVKEIVESLRIGKTGYSYIVSDDSLTLVYTPEEGYTERKKLDNLYKRLNKRQGDVSLDSFIHFLAKKRHYEKKNGVHEEFLDKFSGVKKWRVYAKFPKQDWTLVTIFPLDQLAQDDDVLRRESIIGIIWLTVSLGFLFVWLSLRGTVRDSRDPSSAHHQYWKLSNRLALTFAVGTVLVWFSAYHFNDGFDRVNDSDSIPYSDQTVLNSTKGDLGKPIKITNKLSSDLYLNRINYLDDFVKIPTALNIETLEFLDANDIRLSGAVWQYLNTTMVNNENPVPQLRFKNALELNFILDQNVDSIPSYDKYGRSLYKWNFTVSLRQDFDYSKYPFDSKALVVRLAPKDMTQSFILVPDFDSYQVDRNYDPITSPKSKPGLSAYLNLTDWTITETFFNYAEPSIKSNFGLTDKQLITNKVELNYSIVIKRNFIGPFIGDLLPFVVISIFLFALFKGLKDKSATGKEGVKTEIVDTAAALFFSLLVSHFKLRDLLEFNKVVYVETFYFILYFAIVLFLINRMLFRSQKFTFINENDNENIKRTYWPLISISIWIVAVLTFL